MLLDYLIFPVPRTTHALFFLLKSLATVSTWSNQRLGVEGGGGGGEKSRFGAKKYSKCMKTWHEASTSGYCWQELKRNGEVVYQGVACSKTKYALNSAQCSKTNQPANISYKLN